MRQRYNPSKRDLLDIISVLLRRNGLRQTKVSGEELSSTPTPLFARAPSPEGGLVISLDVSGLEE